MSILEKRSADRAKSLRNLVDKGEYPVEYALIKLDELNEKGLLTAKDYEETFDYFSEILNKPEETAESTAESAENTEEYPEVTDNEQNNTEVDRTDIVDETDTEETEAE